MAQKGMRMFPRNRRPSKDSLHWVGWTYILNAIDWCSLESPELIQWCRHRTAAPHLSTPPLLKLPLDQVCRKIIVPDPLSQPWVCNPPSQPGLWWCAQDWLAKDEIWMTWNKMCSWAAMEVRYFKGKRKQAGRREDGKQTSYQRYEDTMTSLMMAFSWHRAFQKK